MTNKLIGTIYPLPLLADVTMPNWKLMKKNGPFHFEFNDGLCNPYQPVNKSGIPSRTVIEISLIMVNMYFPCVFICCCAPPFLCPIFQEFTVLVCPCRVAYIHIWCPCNIGLLALEWW